MKRTAQARSRTGVPSRRADMTSTCCSRSKTFSARRDPLLAECTHDVVQTWMKSYTLLPYTLRSCGCAAKLAVKTPDPASAREDTLVRQNARS